MLALSLMSTLFSNTKKLEKDNDRAQIVKGAYMCFVEL